MRIQEITWRHRNDFHYKAVCEHCGNVDRYGDGYADNFYCTQVVPNRHCADCGLNSYGKAAPVECCTEDAVGDVGNALTSTSALSEDGNG